MDIPLTRSDFLRAPYYACILFLVLIICAPGLIDLAGAQDQMTPPRPSKEVVDVIMKGPRPTERYMRCQAQYSLKIVYTTRVLKITSKVCLYALDPTVCGGWLEPGGGLDQDGWATAAFEAHLAKKLNLPANQFFLPPICISGPFAKLQNEIRDTFDWENKSPRNEVRLVDWHPKDSELRGFKDAPLPQSPQREPEPVEPEPEMTGVPD